MNYEILIDGARRTVALESASDQSSRLAASIDGRSVAVDAVKISANVYSALICGRSLEVTVEAGAQGLLVHVAGREFLIEVVDPRSWRGRHSKSFELEGVQQIAASMPGKIVSVLVKQGQKVEASQGLLVIEAMKMQNEIRAPKSGTVERLNVKEGQTVSAGEILAVVS